MFKIFIRRPVLSIVVSLVIAFIGILSLSNLPITQFPSISPPKVNVIANYPGANNELLVKSVIIPLEQALNGIPGMKYIESNAGNDGEAELNVVFKLGTDPNVDAVNVQNRVSSATNKLPAEVIREGVKISREEPNILMYINLYSDDPKVDQGFLYNYFDINISPELLRVDGVGDLDILGTRNCLLLAREKEIKGMLQFSSCDSYGEVFSNQDLNAIDESFVGRLDPLADRSCYSMGKAAGESLCHAYALAYNLPVKILRIAHTYAPLMPLDDGRVFADFVGNALCGENIALNSDGSAERPLLYIVDAIRAYFRVLFLGKLGDAYNVAAEENTSIRMFAELVTKLAPYNGLHVIAKKEERQGYLQAPMKRIKISIKKLQALGYIQKHTLADGMQRVLKSYGKVRR